MTALRPHCCAALLLLAAAGCRATFPAPLSTQRPALEPVSQAAFDAAGSTLKRSDGPHPIATVNYQEPLPSPRPLHDEPAADKHSPIPEAVLSREWLQAEIEAQNPSLEAMIAAWQAATQLYPQRVALDDPMLMGMIAPQSAASSRTETAYALQLNQKLPWFGKRQLRGAAAESDAQAAFQDALDTRLQVRLAAEMAFLEYFLAARLIEINLENARIAEQFRETAASRYRANQVTQQDVLQAELELAEVARRAIELARMRQVAIARINTLIRRAPDAPLPPPPTELHAPGGPIDSSLLWQTALSQRPDLAALARRVESEEAALELAYKNYLPDFDVFGRYDTFWQPASTQGPLRAQLGVAMNVPIWREKLRAAVGEAQFRLNRRRAEFDQRALEIQYEVVAAAEQVEESRQTVGLYAERLLPAAEQNVAAARSNYGASKASFIDLVLTQRQLVMLRERQVEAVVAWQRRLAELNRVTGGTALPTP